MRDLRKLLLGYNRLVEITPEIGFFFFSFFSLFFLFLIPLFLLLKIGKLTDLIELNLDENKLKRLPPEIGKMISLEVLRFPFRFKFPISFNGN